MWGNREEIEEVSRDVYVATSHQPLRSEGRLQSPLHQTNGQTVGGVYKPRRNTVSTSCSSSTTLSMALTGSRRCELVGGMFSNTIYSTLLMRSQSPSGWISVGCKTPFYRCRRVLVVGTVRHHLLTTIRSLASTPHFRIFLHLLYPVSLIVTLMRPLPYHRFAAALLHPASAALACPPTRHHRHRRVMVLRARQGTRPHHSATVLLRGACSRFSRSFLALPRGARPLLDRRVITLCKEHQRYCNHRPHFRPHMFRSLQLAVVRSQLLLCSKLTIPCFSLP